MKQKKLLDFGQAVGDEAVDIGLSTVLPEVVKTYGDVMVSEGVSIIASEILAAIAPRANSVRLSYKQNRLECNIGIALQKLVDDNQSLANRIAVLEQSLAGQQLLHQSGELLLDNIVDEFQENKVKYSVNGYVNLLYTDDANMDMALMFFKTLSELNDLDIRILQQYDYPVQISSDSELSELDYTQVKYIKEKLVRLGLLRSKNDELTAKNLEMIVKYLQDLDKQSRARKPKDVKVPRFNKIHRTDSYKITSLGRAFLQLISERCDLTNINVEEETNDDEIMDDELDLSMYL